MKLKDLLTVPEASKQLGVSRQTLYTWMDEGILAYIQKGAQRLIFVDALVAAKKLMEERGKSWLWRRNKIK